MALPNRRFLPRDPCFDEDVFMSETSRDGDDSEDTVVSENESFMLIDNAEDVKVEKSSKSTNRRRKHGYSSPANTSIDLLAPKTSNQAKRSNSFPGHKSRPRDSQGKHDHEGRGILCSGCEAIKEDSENWMRDNRTISSLETIPSDRPLDTIETRVRHTSMPDKTEISKPRRPSDLPIDDGAGLNATDQIRITLSPPLHAKNKAVKKLSRLRRRHSTVSYVPSGRTSAINRQQLMSQSFYPFHYLANGSSPHLHHSRCSYHLPISPLASNARSGGKTSKTNKLWRIGRSRSFIWVCTYSVHDYTRVKSSFVLKSFRAGYDGIKVNQ